MKYYHHKSFISTSRLGTQINQEEQTATRRPHMHTPKYTHTHTNTPRPHTNTHTYTHTHTETATNTLTQTYIDLTQTHTHLCSHPHTDSNTHAHTHTMISSIKSVGSLELSPVAREISCPRRSTRGFRLGSKGRSVTMTPP